jgi:phosphoribosylaminoimidazole carboxylase (NCAIR synthetase)
MLANILYPWDMVRVLVLGGSFSAVEIIKCIKDLGFFVIVCGRDREEAGHHLADESVFLDYSDSLMIADYIRNHPVNFIVPTANDAAYRTGLELNKIFRFPGFDDPVSGLCFLEKHEFRNLCKNLGLTIPDFQSSTTKTLMASQLNFEAPFLIKPINGFSGKGIIRIQSEADRKKLENQISIENAEEKFVIEEYLEGTLHSHSAFIQERRIVKDFFVDEFCVINDFAVDSSNHPSSVGDEIQSQVRVMINRILEKSHLVDGLIHTQFIISKGQAFLIESMRRCPGDLYPNLIKLSTGFDYIYNYVAPFLQLPFDSSSDLKNLQLPIARFTLASRTNTIVFGVNVFSECQNFSFYPLIKNGDHLKPFPEAKVGVLFIELKSSKDLFSAVPHFQQKIGIID